MSQEALRRGRITPADIAASYPPYPPDWYLEGAEPDSRGHNLKAEEQERVAKEHALKFADDERVAKENALKFADDERVAKERAFARIAELEALLAGRQ